MQLLPLYCGACMPLAGLVVDDLQEHASSLQVSSGVLLLLSVVFKLVLPVRVPWPVICVSCGCGWVVGWLWLWLWWPPTHRHHR